MPDALRSGLPEDDRLVDQDVLSAIKVLWNPPFRLRTLAADHSPVPPACLVHVAVMGRRVLQAEVSGHPCIETYGRGQSTCRL